jgi:periplasmic copper chaperone A
MAALLGGAIVVLVLPTSAQGHVELEPTEQAADEFVREDVRVPNERDNASTTKVEVRFPSGFLFASYEPVPGWNGKITTEKLAKPVPSPEPGEPPIKEQVKQATFTATNGKGIGPGQFQDFGLSLLMPKKPGATLTFKAIQTYSDGDVVRWIGPPDSEEPAPQVKLTSGGETSATPTGATTSKDDNDASKGLGIAALVVGIVGVLVGGAALATRRRRA